MITKSIKIYSVLILQAKNNIAFGKDKCDLMKEQDSKDLLIFKDPPDDEYKLAFNQNV